MRTEYIMDTPLGPLQLQGDHSGLETARFTNLSPGSPEDIPAGLKEAVDQLNAYFEGSRTVFELSLNLSGTEFQQAVWEALMKIPFGKTISYQELANRLGDPKVIRAAASANGKNPVAIVVPCHRVIGSDGSLTGYAGGIHRKKWLLEHESPIKQVTLF